MTIWHMNGAGNDFMVADVRGQTLDLQESAKELCKLTDADGFMAVDHSAIADFKLHFYNADGLRGEMCGNGARCLCRFAFENGIAGETMTVETDAGIICCQRLSESVYRLQLNLPSLLELQRKPGVAYTELGDPGLPHAMVELADLSWQNMEAMRPAAIQLRQDAIFPKGININYFTELSAGEVRILTYERGVEDYTLACGTGSAGVALTLWAQGRLPENKLLAHNRGGDLMVTVEEDAAGQLRALFLEGPTETTNRYEYVASAL